MYFLISCRIFRLKVLISRRRFNVRRSCHNSQTNFGPPSSRDTRLRDLGISNATRHLFTWRCIPVARRATTQWPRHKRPERGSGAVRRWESAACFRFSSRSRQPHTSSSTRARSSASMVTSGCTAAHSRVPGTSPWAIPPQSPPPPKSRLRPSVSDVLKIRRVCDAPNKNVSTLRRGTLRRV
jgi:hypothetical protein